jgi:hypothetical protein
VNVEYVRLAKRKSSHPVHPFVLTQIIDSYISTHAITADSNRPSHIRAIPVRSRCTFATNGRECISQPWFDCRACNFTGNLACCAACAVFCHRGHAVIAMGIVGASFCDCGERRPGKCQCMAEPESDDAVGTIARIGRCSVEQQSFDCQTCGLVGNSGCCEVCARLCRAGHQISGAATEAGFCDCGGRCR